MAKPRILVAGIGNVFLGDDGFGVEVARRLALRKLPECVRVTDFGIRGFDLAYALMDERQLTILVDAVPRGGEPGTLYTIEPDLKALDELDPELGIVDTHGMNPLRVLKVVRNMGGQFHRILIIGCEPTLPEDDQAWNTGLTPRVQSAVDEAVRMIESLVTQMASTDENRGRPTR